MKVRVNGRLIRELRIKRSYSQEKLAEIVGVNLRTIQRIETNGAASLSTRRALANALGVQPEDLDVAEPSAAAAGPIESARYGPRWALLGVAVVLVVLGAGVLVVSADNATPVGLLTVSAVGGMLTALAGFVLLTRQMPLPIWRTYVVPLIVAVALVASPPAWTARALVVISLWAAFELGIMATRSTPRLEDARGGSDSA